MSLLHDVRMTYVTYVLLKLSSKVRPIKMLRLSVRSLSRAIRRCPAFCLQGSLSRGLHAATTSHLDLRAAVGSDNIVRSPFPAIEPPHGQLNLCDQIMQNFSNFGPKIAVVNGITGREYSFNELSESIARLSSAFNRLGLQRGEVVALCAPNCPEYGVVFLATLASGGTVSTINPTYTADEIAYQFKNSGSRVVVTVPAILPTVREAAEKAGVQEIVVLDDAHQREVGLLSYTDLIKDSGSRFNVATVDSKNDLACLPYSSGTTGLPKGVMLTHCNIASNVLQMNHPEIFDLSREGMSLLGLLPFFHIYGMVVILFQALLHGNRLIVLPKFEPETFLSVIERYRVTFAHLVPPLVLFLAKHPDVDKYDTSSLEDVFSGAAPLGGDVVKAVNDRLGRTMVRQGYGLTETSPVTHTTPIMVGMSKPQSVGPPIRSTMVKIVSPEGECLPAGKEGEVLIGGPQVMKGYLNLPEATSSSITEDGYFRTGDIGYYDDEGCFYITDRLKELIKVKGLQVAPAELEALLHNHPKIQDAAVIGVPNERLGEAPKAFVVKKDQSITDQEVAEYIAGKLAPHKHLAGGVEFIEAIPKSASGKILRRLLKK